MALATRPLIAVDAHDLPVHRGSGVGLTDTGARVLAGRDDHVQLTGIDRWIGGVHLHGPYAAWRWDDSTETITRARHAPS